ncbi:hypothetical protein FE257_004400 [Aspergillus nanangensis]|uniref:NADH:ubiquinone oxidoreductase intermediate-associated protein 30 domain-containing protein n=1 Tax=Aspergillus nanangensis TaxID=2582783 RepID=A0AAD4GYC8_ASPNN|nr:hypothetical protein FE257_004400 [Aspergillus nanangensis]
MPSNSELSLFGGDRPWSPEDWTASDDRVRGGSSHSMLECSKSSPSALFHGHLDTHTLGGAGFASQRTTGEDRKWDLAKYDGLQLKTNRSDGKRYAITLKDTLLEKRPDGRDRSTISWEYDFRAEEKSSVFVKWSDFTPTYRGKEVKDAEPLDLGNIKRISLMMRSFFGTQEGDFSLEIDSIAAVRTDQYYDDSDSDEEWVRVNHFDEKASASASASPNHKQKAFQLPTGCCWFF